MTKEFKMMAKMMASSMKATEKLSLTLNHAFSNFFFSSNPPTTTTPASKPRNDSKNDSKNEHEVRRASCEEGKYRSGAVYKSQVPRDSELNSEKGWSGSTTMVEEQPRPYDGTRSSRSGAGDTLNEKSRNSVRRVNFEEGTYRSGAVYKSQVPRASEFYSESGWSGSTTMVEEQPRPYDGTRTPRSGAEHVLRNDWRNAGHVPSRGGSELSSEYRMSAQPADVHPSPFVIPSWEGPTYGFTSRTSASIPPRGYEQPAHSEKTNWEGPTSSFNSRTSVPPGMVGQPIYTSESSYIRGTMQENQKTAQMTAVDGARIMPPRSFSAVLSGDSDRFINAARVPVTTGGPTPLLFNAFIIDNFLLYYKLKPKLFFKLTSLFFNTKDTTYINFKLFRDFSEFCKKDFFTIIYELSNPKINIKNVINFCKVKKIAPNELQTTLRNASKISYSINLIKF